MQSIPSAPAIRKLALHDVDDVELLCRRVLETRLSEWGAHLRRDLYEDALAYLVATAWELSTVYDPELGPSFSTYCYRLLRRRLVDWYRSTFGDSRHAPRPELVSLDRALRLDGDQELEERLGQVDDGYERVLAAESARIPLDTLSEEARWTLEHVARPLANGSSSEELARRLGKSRRHLNRHLDELREELRLLDPELAA